MDTISPAAEFIFRSRLPDVVGVPDHLPLHTYCFQHAHEHRDKPCIINASTGEVYSFSEVESISRHVACGLRRLGVMQHDVIMLLLPNCPEFAFSFLAASMLGACSTTANPAYTAGEVQKQIAAAGVKVVVTEASSLPKVKNMANTVIVVVGEEGEGYTAFSKLCIDHNADEVEVDISISPEDVVALPFSSGTTGLPKGVMLTHRSLINGVAQQVDGENPTLYLNTSDAVLCVLPLFHIYSLNSVLLCCLRTGAAVVMMRRFEMTAMCAAVEKYKVTVAPFVPPIIIDLVKNPDLHNHDLSSVRTVMCGAAPLSKEVEDKLRVKLPGARLGQGYGMTEAGSVLAMSVAFGKDPFPIRSGSCGSVIRNAKVKVVDPDSGASQPRNNPGEICIRGAQVMKGYLNNPTATAAAIDKQGWLHTGDIGYVDDDGEVFIVERLKEMIKYNGYQVAPAEIEALLVSHPCIADAAVVPMKAERSGEVPVAFVKLTATQDTNKLRKDEIMEYVANQVVFYKRIHDVFFLDCIPKNPSGKILRKELKKRLAAGALIY